MSQDGCYSEGAHWFGKGSVSRGQKKRDALQLRHRLPRSQRENVQVSIPIEAVLASLMEARRGGLMNLHAMFPFPPRLG